MLRTEGRGPVITSDNVLAAAVRFRERGQRGGLPDAAKYLPSFIYAKKKESMLPLLPTGESSPNDWFDFDYPELVATYGRAFYTVASAASCKSNLYHPDACLDGQVVGINASFFGAFLGGDKRYGHAIRYSTSDNMFYFFDPIDEAFYPTFEGKLRLLFTRILRECSSEREPEVTALLLRFCSSESIWNEIMHAAKYTLAADDAYFESFGPGKWYRSKDKKSSDQLILMDEFVRNSIEPASGILTYGDAYRGVRAHIGTQLPKNVKILLNGSIKAIHGKKLRNDLRDSGGSCVRGWTGLRVKADELMLPN